VIDLAKRRGIDVIERRIMPEELSGFEECFICGTGAEVTPVAEAGPYKFMPGVISRAMIDDYSAEVRPKQQAA
jgi:branched-chain amino acid aminotransferase